MAPPLSPDRSVAFRVGPPLPRKGASPPYRSFTTLSVPPSIPALARPHLPNKPLPFQASVRCRSHRPKHNALPSPTPSETSWMYLTSSYDFMS